MVCTYHESRAFKEFVTPNRGTYGLNITVPTLQMDRLSQRGNLKQGDTLPTGGGTEASKHCAFKQKLEMASLGRKQPITMRPEATPNWLLAPQPSSPRCGYHCWASVSGQWRSLEQSSSFMSVSHPNQSLSLLKAGGGQRRGHGNEDQDQGPGTNYRTPGS